MTELGHEAPVKVYMNRGIALLFALGCAAFCAIGVWHYLDHTIPPVMTHPWTYYEPGRTIVSAAGVLIFGPLGLLMLYFVFMPLPMFELDVTGMTYRWPFKWGKVRWDEIATITANKWVSNSQYPRFSTRLTLRITLTQGAVVASGRKSQVKLEFGQLFLPMSVEELVSRIRKYHEVITTSGFSQHDLLQGSHGEYL